MKCDLDRLATEVTIVSNAHYLIWDELSYVPTFLVVEDRLVAEDRVDDLRSLAIPKVFPFDLFHLLGPATPDRIFVNFPRDYRPFPQFSFDLARRAYWGGTVSFLNLQLAAYLGCNPVILIGFDHNYVVPAADIDNHVIVSRDEDINHIHPDYFGPGYRWHDPDLARMELAYRCADEAMRRAGIQVLNATVGGKLEVFDRADYDAVTR
jgi:hypothetical protein